MLSKRCTGSWGCHVGAVLGGRSAVLGLYSELGVLRVLCGRYTRSTGSMECCLRGGLGVLRVRDCN